MIFKNSASMSWKTLFPLQRDQTLINTAFGNNRCSEYKSHTHCGKNALHGHISKVAVSFTMPECLFVHLHGTTQLWLNGIS
jgi:hypothetical protein